MKITLIVRIRDKGVLDSLIELGRVVFVSDLTDLVCVEVEEAAYPQVTNLPGVISAAPERIGEFLPSFA